MKEKKGEGEQLWQYKNLLSRKKQTENVEPQTPNQEVMC